MITVLPNNNISNIRTPIVLHCPQIGTAIVLRRQLKYPVTHAEMGVLFWLFWTVGVLISLISHISAALVLTAMNASSSGLLQSLAAEKAKGQPHRRWRATGSELVPQ
jgi:hypothetical protein